MAWHYIPYFVILHLSAILSIVLAVILWRRRTVPGILPAVFILFCMLLWAISNIIGMVSLDLEGKLFGINLQFIATAFIPAAWLVLVIQHSSQKLLPPKWVLLLLAVEPLLIVVLTLVNSELLWSQSNPIFSPGRGGLEFTYNVGGQLHLVYSYFLFLIGVASIAWYYLTAHAGQRVEILGFSVIAIAPWLGHLVDILGLSFLPKIALGPLIFTLITLLLSWLLRRYWVTNIIPVARSTIVDGLDEGVFVLNPQDQVVDLNPAARKILGKPATKILGRSGAEIFAAWPELALSKFTDQELADPGTVLLELEVTANTENGQSHYRVRASILPNRRGRLVVWSNITPRKQIEKKLLRQLEELSVLHNVAVACVEATSEDLLIEQATQVIGEILYPDNIGVLLLEETTGHLHFHPSYRGLPESKKDITFGPGKGITGQVAASGQPLRVEDVSKAQNYICLNYQTSAELCVPIKLGERVLGVINAESFRIGAFAEADERLLTTLAGQLATGIERLRVEAAERRRSEELLAVTNVSREITSMLDREQVLSTIARLAADISKSDACGVFTYSPPNNYNMVAAHGVGEEFFQVVKVRGIPLPQTAVGRAIAELQPVQIPDLLKEPDYPTLWLADMEQIRAVLALPLMHGKEAIGGIVLWHRQPRHFAQEEIRFLQALAQQSVNAIQNAQLFEAEREQRKLADILREVGTVLSSTLEIDAVLDHLLHQVERVVPYDTASVMIIEGKQARITRLKSFQHYEEQVVQALRSMSWDIETTANLRRMIETKQPLIIPNTKEDPGWIETDYTLLAHSWAGAPIIEGDKVVGLFSLDKNETNFYRPEHTRRLALFAGQAALAMQNAGLFQEMSRRASHLEALNAVIAAAASATDLKTLLLVALEHIFEALNLNTGGVYLHGQYLTQHIPDKVLDLFLPGSQQDGERAAVVVVENWQAEVEGGQWQSLAPAMLGEGQSASVVIPLLSDGKQAGVFLLSTTAVRSWSKEEVVLIQAIGKQLGVTADRLALLEETQQRLREVTLLSKVIALSNISEDIPSALGKICQEVALFFDSPQSAFALLDDAGASAEVVAEYLAPGRPSAMGVKIPVAENPALVNILKAKTPAAIWDVHDDPLLKGVGELMHQRGTVSMILVPILQGEKVVGTLGIDTLEPYEFGANDLALLKNITTQIGQTLERNHLFKAAQEHAREMAHLAAHSGALNKSFTGSEVLKGIGEGAMELAGADRGAIFVRHLDDNIASPWYKGLSAEYIELATTRTKDIPGGRLLQQKDPILISDVSQLPDPSLLKEMATKENYHGLALWPLIYEGRVIASVGCYYDLPHMWTAEQQEIMLTFIRQAAVALQNARLFDEARRRATQQQALNAIIAAAVGAPDLQNLLEDVLILTMDAIDVEQGGLWVGNKVVLRGLPQELGAPSIRAEASKVGAGVNVTQAIDDWLQAPQDEYMRVFAPYMRRYSLRASLTVPVTVEGKHIGALSLASSTPRKWDEDEIALAEAIGHQLGSAVERINLLAKTQEQARQVQQIMDTVPEGVVLLTTTRKIVLANPAAWQYLSALVDDPDLDQPLFTLAGYSIEELLRSNAERPWVELETKGKLHRVFEVAARPLESKAQVEGWVLVLREVTQERENQMRIQMQERLATVGQLAAGIAHDFNNIMAAIVVYTDLLGMEPNLGTTSRERLDIIQQQVLRATSLIRQILDFSRRSVMEPSTLDLLPFIKELDKLLGRVLPENIRLELTYQPESYQVRADPTRLQQVFMNLALNARDAMPSGGLVHFDLKCIQLHPLDPSPSPDLTPGKWVRIKVKDTGVGISPEVLPHIFDPFFTTKPIGKGTGLGLAQVYGIVKQHGGTIDVESSLGEGTTFILYLPALDMLEGESQSTKKSLAMHGAGQTILVTEDDPIALQALKALLETYEYTVLTAHNGAEALRIFEQNEETVDLLITDVVMPEMGGMTLYHALQENWPMVKVLFVTGHPLDSKNQALLEKGQVHWLQKPFSVQEFAQVVQTLLQENEG